MFPFLRFSCDHNRKKLYEEEFRQISKADSLILIFSFYRLYPVAEIMVAVVKDRLFSQCSPFPPFIRKYVLSKTSALIENRTETIAVALLLLRNFFMSVNVSWEGKQHWWCSCGQTHQPLSDQPSKVS